MCMWKQPLLQLVTKTGHDRDFFLAVPWPLLPHLWVWPTDSTKFIFHKFFLQTHFTNRQNCYDWQCLPQSYPRPLRQKGNGHLYIKKSNTVNPVSFFQNLIFEWTWAGNLTKRWPPEKRRWPWRALGLNGSPSIPKGGCSILKEGFSMSFFLFFSSPSSLSVQQGREAPRQRRGMWVGFEKEEWKMLCPFSE